MSSMPPQYMYDVPCQSILTPPCRLASRRSFSSLSRSPSTSPGVSPQKRYRKQPQDSSSVPSATGGYQVLWTAVWFFLILLCGLRWMTTTSSPTRPPLLRNSETRDDPRWKNVNVVQVIQTRFMQDQPSLIDLGLARLEIFKAFCLPTVVAQSSQDFLWIIRTDPMLNDSIKQPLLELLQDYPNFILLASNANPEGFRGDDALEDVTRENVWSGRYDTVLAYHKAAQSRVVLESRLDADDGLHYGFAEFLQATAPSYLSQDRWMVWCAFSHLEWHYNSPFPSLEDNVDYGFLIGIKNSACVTSGLTMAYGLGVTRDELPRGTHQYLHKVLPACSDEHPHECLRRFNELAPGAIRARTPTSAGMANLVIHDGKKRTIYKNADSQARLQNAMWDGVERIFHIQQQDATRTRNYL